jgi:GntR family transcriptional regulator
MLNLDHGSPVPLRAQVETLIRQMVLQPEYQRGGLLPDEMALAAELGVSRGTVRAGISKLVYEGLLERKAGIGTRVSSRSLESGITAWRSFTREMASKGITVENYRLDYRLAEAGPDAVRTLHLNDRDSVWRLDRVRGWSGKPVLQSTSWFHPRIGLKGNEDTTKPLYEMIESATGVRPSYAREEFSAMRADAHLARLLDVRQGTALLLRRHTVFDQGGRPFEYTEVNYVSSRFTLTLEMRRGEE